MDANGFEKNPGLAPLVDEFDHFSLKGFFSSVQTPTTFESAVGSLVLLFLTSHSSLSFKCTKESALWLFLLDSFTSVRDPLGFSILVFSVASSTCGILPLFTTSGLTPSAKAAGLLLGLAAGADVLLVLKLARVRSIVQCWPVDNLILLKKHYLPCLNCLRRDLCISELFVEIGL